MDIDWKDSTFYFRIADAFCHITKPDSLEPLIGLWSTRWTKDGHGITIRMSDMWDKITDEDISIPDKFDIIICFFNETDKKECIKRYKNIEIVTSKYKDTDNLLVKAEEECDWQVLELEE